MRDVIVPLWQDWEMMNRLHCSKAELDVMDAGEYAIFVAFARGEREGSKLAAQEAQAVARMKG